MASGEMTVVYPAKQKDWLYWLLVAIAVLWSGLQKLGAVAAVSLGVLHLIFSRIALLVAAMDLVSGILILLYWRRIRGA
jgi:hypothetical protein